MSNQAVAERLSALKEELAAALSGGASAGPVVSRVITAAVEATAAGVRPSTCDVRSAAQRWSTAHEDWASASEEVGRTGAKLTGTTWTGTDAAAATVALRGLSDQAVRRGAACDGLSQALSRLGDGLAEPTRRLDDARARLGALDCGSVGPLTTEITATATQVSTLISSMQAALSEADQLANETARVVAGHAESLTFPSQSLASLAAPFVAATRWIPLDAQQRKLAPPQRSRYGAHRSAARVAPKPSSRKPATPGAHRSPQRPTGSARPVRPVVKRPALRAPALPTPVRPQRVTPTIRLRTTPTRPPVSTGRPVVTQPTSSSSRKRADLLKTVRRLQGTPYRWGGTTPKGFDCSGFVQYVYRQIGVRLPRTSSAQRHAGTLVPRSQAKPGDIVHMPGHVGIYLGNGMMADAPRPGRTVGIRRIWTSNYVIVRIIRN